MSAAAKVAEPGLYAVVRVLWSPPIGDSQDDPLSSLFVRMPRNPADSDSPSEWLWWQPDDAAGWTWNELHDRAAAVEVVRFGRSTADPHVVTAKADALDEAVQLIRFAHVQTPYGDGWQAACDAFAARAATIREVRTQRIDWEDHQHSDAYCSAHCKPGTKHSQCGCSCDHKSIDQGRT